MVTNSRKKASPSPIRALNLPELIEVEEDNRQAPVSLTRGRRTLQVASVEDVWEIMDEWWRTRAIARRYYRIILDDGPAMVLFRDLASGLWYEQRG